MLKEIYLPCASEAAIYKYRFGYIIFFLNWKHQFKLQSHMNLFLLTNFF